MNRRSGGKLKRLILGAAAAGTIVLGSIGFGSEVATSTKLKKRFFDFEYDLGRVRVVAIYPLRMSDREKEATRMWQSPDPRHESLLTDSLRYWVADEIAHYIKKHDSTVSTLIINPPDSLEGEMRLIAYAHTQMEAQAVVIPLFKGSGAGSGGPKIPGPILSGKFPLMGAAPSPPES